MPAKKLQEHEHHVCILKSILAVKDLVLTHSRMYRWSAGSLKAMFFRPLMISRTKTPKLNTSAFSDTWPKLAYSGDRYPLKVNAKHVLTPVLIMNRLKNDSTYKQKIVK